MTKEKIEWRKRSHFHFSIVFSFSTHFLRQRSANCMLTYFHHFVGNAQQVIYLENLAVLLEFLFWISLDDSV